MDVFFIYHFLISVKFSVVLKKPSPMMYCVWLFVERLFAERTHCASSNMSTDTLQKCSVVIFFNIGNISMIDFNRSHSVVLKRVYENVICPFSNVKFFNFELINLLSFHQMCIWTYFYEIFLLKYVCLIIIQNQGNMFWYFILDIINCHALEVIKNNMTKTGMDPGYPVRAPTWGANCWHISLNLYVRYPGGGGGHTGCTPWIR